MDVLAVADERAGVRNQAQGLAEALAVEIGGAARLLVVSSGDGKRFAPLMERLPNVAVGCGRSAMAELVALRKRGVRTVYVQDPRRGYDRFDLVVAPEHDGIRAPNAIAMVGGPHRVNADALAAAKTEWTELAALPSPRVAVMIGGKSKRHDFDAGSLAAQMKAFAEVLAMGGSLMMSVSRRTPESLVVGLRKLSGKHPDRVQLYAGDGANPYLGYLAHAEAVMVTEDSSNMLVEACATGVPVFRLAMAGDAGKLGQLYARLSELCAVGRWNGQSVGEPYAPLRETERVAKVVAERLGL